MTATQGSIRILELATARLCLDLSGMAGSVGVGQNQDMQAALDRLRLRQAAWEPGDQAVSLRQVAGLAAGLGPQVTLDLSALPASLVFPAAAGRIIVNLLLLAKESLPNGGMVILAGAADDLFVRIMGAGAAWPAGLGFCVADEPAARAALQSPDSLQMALTALLAHHLGVRLSLVLPSAGRDQPAMLRLGGG